MQPPLYENYSFFTIRYLVFRARLKLAGSALTVIVIYARGKHIREIAEDKARLTRSVLSLSSGFLWLKKRKERKIEFSVPHRHPLSVGGIAALGLGGSGRQHYSMSPLTHCNSITCC